MKVVNINEELVAYMQEKYGEAYDDTFTFEEATGAHFGKSVRTIRVKSERYPGAEIVARYEKRDGTEIFSDNYMAIVYEKEVQAAIEEAVKEVYGNSKVFYRPAAVALPEEIGPQTTLQEFTGVVEAEINAVIFVETRDIGDRDVLLETLRRTLKGKGLLIRGSICYINQEGMGQVTEADYQTDSARNIRIDARCAFALDSEYEFLYADWS